MNFAEYSNFLHILRYILQIECVASSFSNDVKELLIKILFDLDPVALNTRNRTRFFKQNPINFQLPENPEHNSTTLAIGREKKKWNLQNTPGLGYL